MSNLADEEERKMILKQVEAELDSMTNEEIQQKIRLFDNNIRAMNSEVTKINFDISQSKARIIENEEKIKLNK